MSGALLVDEPTDAFGMVPLILWRAPDLERLTGWRHHLTPDVTVMDLDHLTTLGLGILQRPFNVLLLVPTSQRHVDTVNAAGEHCPHLLDRMMCRATTVCIANFHSFS